MSAIRRDPTPTSSRLASTALQPEVKEREEHDSRSSIVGGSGKGAEGVHFQGKLKTTSK